MKKTALTLVLVITAAAGTAQAAHALKAKPPRTPQVSTAPATAVSQTAATLNGSVNPRGLATTYHFQYGQTTAYGGSTASLSAGAGTTAKSVSARVSGLAPATTYHYRLVATNAAGTTFGKDAHFTTLSRLTIAVRPRPIVYGSATTVSGQLQAQNNSGKEIDLQANPYPYKGFVTVGTTTTDGLGHYSFANRRPGANTRYRTVTAKGTLLTSAIVKLGVRIRLTRQVSDSTPAKGQKVRFSGFACPAHAGKVVSLQRRSSGHWVTVKQTHLVLTSRSATCAKRSRYKMSITVFRNGTFRTVAAADRDHLNGISPKVAITVH